MKSRIALRKGDVVEIALQGTRVGSGYVFPAASLLAADKSIRALTKSAGQEGVRFAPGYEYDGRRVRLTVASVSTSRYGAESTVTGSARPQHGERLAKLSMGYCVDSAEGVEPMGDGSPSVPAVDCAVTGDGFPVTRRGPALVIVNGVSAPWAAPHRKSDVASFGEAEGAKISLVFESCEYYLRDRKKDRHVSPEDPKYLSDVSFGAVMQIVDCVEEVVRMLPDEEADSQMELDLGCDGGRLEGAA